MKKFLVFALAAMTVVACSKKDDEPSSGSDEQTQTKLTISESSLKLTVGQTTTLTATLDVEWTSTDEEVATVSAAGKVEAIAAGQATIIAESEDGQTARCEVVVSAKDEPKDPETPVSDNDYSDFKQLQGSAYYIFALQAGATEYLGDKVIYNFAPNDNAGQGSRWLYVWGGTFNGADAVGTDPFDYAEKWTCMTQADGTGWAGMGYIAAVTGENNTSGEGVAEDLAAMNAIKDNITDYDEWYFAVAMKNSAAGAAYSFKLIGGSKEEVQSGVGEITITPAATGEWVYKEYKLSEIAGLEYGSFDAAQNLIEIVANPYLPGTEYNLGYAFIYKK